MNTQAGTSRGSISVSPDASWLETVFIARVNNTYGIPICTSFHDQSMRRTNSGGEHGPPDRTDGTRTDRVLVDRAFVN